MARSTMARLITRLRLLVNDPAGGGQVFADDEIQDTADMHRQERWWVPLRPLPTFGADHNIQYLTYIADSNWGAFEDGAKLQRADYSVLDSGQITDFNPYPGRWEVSADAGEVQGLRGITLRVTGRTYDLYWTAAELLFLYAARLKAQFDFTSTSRDEYKRSQQIAMTLQLAQKYLGLAQPVNGRLVSGDMMPDGAGGGLVYPNVVPGYYGGTSGFGW